jgi:hypothetical protein
VEVFKSVMVTLGPQQEKHTKCTLRIANGVPHVLIPRGRYSGVIEVLQWCPNGVTVVLQ